MLTYCIQPENGIYGRINEARNKKSLFSLCEIIKGARFKSYVPLVRVKKKIISLQIQRKIKHTLIPYTINQVDKL